MTPRRHARYRSANGDVWDTRHYESDDLEFVDGAGLHWRRVAVTDREYVDVSNAKAELDEREQGR